MTNITCRGCSLLCDDLTVRIENQKLIDHVHACPLAKNWIQDSLQVVSAEKQEDAPENLSLAKKWLDNAISPLICGLQGLTLEAESKVVELANQRNARLSAGTSPDKFTTYQRYGGATCTLGEVHQRADLVLVGNCDLLAIWPRFAQQYLAKPGRFISPEQPRELIFLGDASLLDKTSQYSQIIDIPGDQLDQAVLLLRRIIQKQSIKQADSELTSQLEKLADKLLAAWYPVLFHDDSLKQNGFLWTKLVNEVNQLSRMHSLNVTAGVSKGAASETILAMTGFPDHIAFCGATPEDDETEILHDSLRYEASQLIQNQNTDLVIFAGDQLSKKWLETLQNLAPPAKLIVIHSGITKLPRFNVPVLEILTQTPGIHETGTALRCDGVPLPLHAVATSQLPTICDVMASLKN
ncbi:MAG: hypothetical protein JKY95_09150 [Planctomycetaceae bacterium]|nr:hypothetical protein [Planctomycetaceae bacterium]